MDNQCPNCLKIFTYKYLLDKHITATRTCHKVELVNGEVISDKKSKCEDCDMEFQNKYTLARHKKNTCNGKIVQSKVNSDNVINSNNTNCNIDNSLNLDIDNSTNISFNIGVLNEKMKPKTEFKVIDKDLITMQNLDSYIKDFNEEPEKCTYNNIVELVENILKDKYINNIDFIERNILSINKKRDIHYYDKDGWVFDGNDIFYHSCVIRIIEQLEKIILERKSKIDRLLMDKSKILECANKKIKYESGLYCDYIDNAIKNAMNTIIELHKYRTNKDSIAMEGLNVALNKYNVFCIEFLKTLMMAGLSKQVLSNMKKNFYANNEFRKLNRAIC